MTKVYQLIATEDQEAIALINWAQLHPICKNFLIHIPNEGKRSFFSGKKLKRMGLKRGVSDFFLAYPSGKYHGLWIELKRLKLSKCTDEQIDWVKNMNTLDYKAQFAYGWERARDFIIDYLDS